MTIDRRSEFTAQHKRLPDADEARAIAEQERQDRRQAEAARYEGDLKRGYLATPGATPEQWEKEKGRILEEDRRQRTIATKDAARRAQSALYRNF